MISIEEARAAFSEYEKKLDLFYQKIKHLEGGRNGREKDSRTNEGNAKPN